MVLRDSELPIFGAPSYDSRIVLPDSGPYSRNTVVSWMKETPSGIIMPLLKSCVPNSPAGILVGLLQGRVGELLA